MHFRLVVGVLAYREEREGEIGCACESECVRARKEGGGGKGLADHEQHYRHTPAAARLTAFTIACSAALTALLHSVAACA